MSTRPFTPVADASSDLSKNLSDFDLGWIVGIVDGEGCLTWRKRESFRAGGTPLVTVSMSDEDTIRRLAGLWGVSCYREKKNNGGKPLWRLEVSGNRAVAWMQLMLPHLSQRRHERALGLIDRWCERRPARKSGRKLGSIPWNKGTVGTQIAWNKGLHRLACVRDHDLSGAYTRPDGYRQCRICQRDRERAYRIRKRAA